MLRYAKVENADTGLCSVGIGTNIEFYEKIGMEKLDVEQGADGRWYLSGYEPLSPYHKWNGTEWVPDASKRQEILAKLTKLFNKETETLIHDSEITFENINGAITLKCDETNQKNFTAAYTARDILEFPFNIWEGDQELELQTENELKQVCSLIFSTVEGVRRTRKEIRDTFKDKTTSELIELLKEIEE